MITAIWETLCQLSPWLLLGMVLSALLHVFLPENFVRRKFQGASGVLKAVLLGVPLPLCSCGVIPAGIGLKNQGASDGAAVGFLISTPQTGVDSILVSASFFGWPFAIFKMLSAAVTGVVGGLWADQSKQPESDASVGEPEPPSPKQSNQPWYWKLIDHSLEIIRSIWVWLVIGIVISALIDVYVPQQWIKGFGELGLWPSMILVLLISTPLYVCATASVPIAAALVAGGLPPAAALVFLMAGPATNVTTIGAIKSRFGWRTLSVYLLTILVGSMLAAYLFDWLLAADVSEHLTHSHEHNNWWSIGSAVLILLMICRFLFEDIQRRLRHRKIRISDSTGNPATKIWISGMTCSGCSNRIETGLGRLNGVESVVVQLDNEVAIVRGNVAKEVLESRIRELGFEPRPQKR